MPYIKYQDKNIYYEDHGSGNRAVVFLHGFLGNLHIWDRYTKDLAECRIITIDLPGHGKSDVLSDIHLMSDMAAAVDQVCQSIGVSNADFVGHSMGGYVGIALIECKPKLVRSLTLFNSTAAEDNAQKKKDRIRTIRVFEMAPELFVSEAINNLFKTENLSRFSDEVKELKKMGLSCGIEGAAPALRGMAERTEGVTLLSESRIPVLYISGISDNIIPIESVKEQVKTIGATIEVMSNSGHMSFIEEYEKTLNTLIKFWSS